MSLNPGAGRYPHPPPPSPACLPTRRGLRESIRGAASSLAARLITSAALERMRRRGDVNGLIRALRSPDPDLRFHAATILGDLRAAAAVPALATLLSGDAPPGLRFAAARALGATGEAAVPVLAGALSHADPEVRWMAALALAEAGGPRAVVMIRPLLADSDPYVVSRAARAIALTGRAGEEVLVAALDDPSDEVRLASVRALARSPRLPGLTALVSALGHPDPALRHAAGEGIARLCRREPGRVAASLREATEEERVTFSGAARQVSGQPVLHALMEAAGESWALLPR